MGTVAHTVADGLGEGSVIGIIPDALAPREVRRLADQDASLAAAGGAFRGGTALSYSACLPRRSPATPVGAIILLGSHLRSGNVLNRPSLELCLRPTAVLLLLLIPFHNHSWRD